MLIFNSRAVLLVAVPAVFACGLSLSCPSGPAEALAAAGSKGRDVKPPITLPKDPEAVVLSYDPGAGGIIRKGAAPYLKIQANGQVTVTNLVDGSQKKSQLKFKQLDDLLRFVIQENDFFGITEGKIDEAIKEAAANGPFIAIGGAGTAVISVEAEGKRNEVKYRGAAAYLSTYPKVEVLAKFVAVESRLLKFAQSIEGIGIGR